MTPNSLIKFAHRCRFIVVMGVWIAATAQADTLWSPPPGSIEDWGLDSFVVAQAENESGIRMAFICRDNNLRLALKGIPDSASDQGSLIKLSVGLSSSNQVLSDWNRLLTKDTYVMLETADSPNVGALLSLVAKSGSLWPNEKSEPIVLANSDGSWKEYFGFALASRALGVFCNLGCNCCGQAIDDGVLHCEDLKYPTITPDGDADQFVDEGLEGISIGAALAAVCGLDQSVFVNELELIGGRKLYPRFESRRLTEYENLLRLGSCNEKKRIEVQGMIDRISKKPLESNVASRLSSPLEKKNVEEISFASAVAGWCGIDTTAMHDEVSLMEASELDELYLEKVSAFQKDLELGGECPTEKREEIRQVVNDTIGFVAFSRCFALTGAKETCWISTCEDTPSPNSVCSDLVEKAPLAEAENAKRDSWVLNDHVASVSRDDLELALRCHEFWNEPVIAVTMRLPDSVKENYAYEVTGERESRKDRTIYMVWRANFGIRRGVALLQPLGTDDDQYGIVFPSSADSVAQALLTMRRVSFRSRDWSTIVTVGEGREHIRSVFQYCGVPENDPSVIRPWQQ